MANEVILNSNTYTDGTSDEGSGKKYLANGGHRTNFIPIFTDMLVEQTAVATNASNAATSETNAATSETNAGLSAAKLEGTSTTSLLIESASKVFITQSSKFFDVGRWLLITSDADPTNYMAGNVTVYSGTSLTVNITNIGGSGTFADWTITVAGVSGVDGSLLDWTADQGVQNIHPNNYDVSTINNNISLLHFYRASDSALSVQDFIDGFMDEYEDETGVDTATSTNEQYDSTGNIYTNVVDSGDIYNGTVTFNGVYDVSGQETAPRGMFVGNSGTKMYVLGQSGMDVNQYTLTTAWDVTGTVTFNGAYSISGQETLPDDVFFSSDGTKMYVVGRTGIDVNQYTLTTAWDVTGTVTFNGAYSVSGQETTPVGLFFSSDGTKMYIIGNTGKDVNQYTLTTAWDVTGSVAFNGAYDVSVQASGSLECVAFNSNGTKMYVLDRSNSDIEQYTITTAWDVTGSVTYNGSYDVSGQETAPRGMFVGNSGTKMYVVGDVGDDVNQYTIDYNFIMTLYSNAFTALSQPASANIVVYEEDVDAVTINTDLISSVSRDGGTTYTSVTLANVGSTTGGQNIYAGEVDISGQPAGTSVKYKLLTTTAEMKIHGVSVQWA